MPSVWYRVVKISKETKHKPITYCQPDNMQQYYQLLPRTCACVKDTVSTVDDMHIKQRDIVIVNFKISNALVKDYVIKTIWL